MKQLKREKILTVVVLTLLTTIVNAHEKVNPVTKIINNNFVTFLGIALFVVVTLFLLRSNNKK
jgi:hypothetical protein